MTNIFNGNWDANGNSYLNCYSNIETKAIICNNKLNTVVKGTPKIVARKGSNSKFGEELLFQFLIKEKLEEYPANSEHGVLEYYLPLKEGLKFLKESVAFLEKEIDQEEKQQTIP